MDILSALLTLHELRSSIDVRCHLQGEWQRPHAAGELNAIHWHGLLDGSARIELANGQRHTLQPGSLTMLPQSAAHRLCNSDGDVRLICGTLYIDPTQRHLLAALPETLIYHEEGTWLTATLQRLFQESAAALPGGQFLCQRLSTVLLTLALRHWLTQTPTQGGLLHALMHPRLGNAIGAMLHQPEQPWSVARLAEISHLSRASFARQFRMVTGSTPLLLLTRIRMAHGAALLGREAFTLADIAERAGYASESAFHHAFVRHMGLTPGDYRRRSHQLAMSADTATLSSPTGAQNTAPVE
ncbi:MULTISPECIES: cupin domain-containing protein [Edwardsiella]|uniref:AraC family transcriptional regulator n=2 Tax=Edwardsiella anguillarum TaxID=1821960 RepID=A0ABY8SK93_9GAMM|nr:AraC family transcriptional regulator [Edwardsiella anguillarum]GAJ66621.1 putative ARAC-type regulatory protein [Edwardsiella piscicida]AIJ09721.1 Putative HTH-type transcriptional regulator ykgD [Edwardsiella anguillarum ET080813]KAB0592666.1 AraC family transcriptional regulator [Edwardsiella anguillarum]RFT03996.1 AraC family transcriptional regulator [Edwardsiella anguillarum]UOU80486.1 AraC family transcriptional regulator [Edwardsiella anguillarum]